MPDDFLQLVALASTETNLPISDARQMIHLISRLFRRAMLDAGHDGRQIMRITTKFRDSGRRSPPWRPASSRIPGRPQDGADGNRINRWLLEEGHKFYAHEITATLVEVKYYLQAFSMTGAPVIPTEVGLAFSWLIEHPVEPGMYVDPIQVIPINLHEVVTDARLIQSGHLIPLDRGGQHEPKNAFLMLARSNQITGQSHCRRIAQAYARHSGSPSTTTCSARFIAFASMQNSPYICISRLRR